MLNPILAVINACMAQLQTAFTFWRTTSNLFMLASCLTYRVNILFKYILGVENITKTIMLFKILHGVIMQNC